MLLEGGVVTFLVLFKLTLLFIFKMCNNCKQWFHLVSSIIGIILGGSAFVVFFFVYENMDAGIWGFLSGEFTLGRRLT
jgi:hypothetical protein